MSHKAASGTNGDKLPGTGWKGTNSVGARPAVPSALGTTVPRAGGAPVEMKPLYKIGAGDADALMRGRISRQTAPASARYLTRHCPQAVKGSGCQKCDHRHPAAARAGVADGAIWPW